MANEQLSIWATRLGLGLDVMRSPGQFLTAPPGGEIDEARLRTLLDLRAKLRVDDLAQIPRHQLTFSDRWDMEGTVQSLPVSLDQNIDAAAVTLDNQSLFAHDVLDQGRTGPPGLPGLIQK